MIGGIRCLRELPGMRHHARLSANFPLYVGIHIARDATNSYPGSDGEAAVRVVLELVIPIMPSARLPSLHRAQLDLSARLILSLAFLIAPP